MSFLKNLKNLKNKLVSNVSSAAKAIRDKTPHWSSVAPEYTQYYGFPHHAVDLVLDDDVSSEYCAVIPEDISGSTIADLYNGDLDEFDLGPQRYNRRYNSRYYSYQVSFDDLLCKPYNNMQRRYNLDTLFGNKYATLCSKLEQDSANYP
ncbi:hypothetical protein MBANPS3_008439 [Mucor bainieri]